MSNKDHSRENYKAFGMTEAEFARAKELSPYLPVGKYATRLTLNYDIAGEFGGGGVMADYIDCQTVDEAKWVMGLLWNTWAGGRQKGPRKP